jgi:hypothetical protein
METESVVNRSSERISRIRYMNRGIISSDDPPRFDASFSSPGEKKRPYTQATATTAATSINESFLSARAINTSVDTARD